MNLPVLDATYEIIKSLGETTSITISTADNQIATIFNNKDNGLLLKTSASEHVITEEEMMKILLCGLSDNDRKNEEEKYNESQLSHAIQKTSEYLSIYHDVQEDIIEHLIRQELGVSRWLYGTEKLMQEKPLEYWVNRINNYQFDPSEYQHDKHSRRAQLAIKNLRIGDRIHFIDDDDNGLLDDLYEGDYNHMHYQILNNFHVNYRCKGGELELVENGQFKAINTANRLFYPLFLLFVYTPYGTTPEKIGLYRERTGVKLPFHTLTDIIIKYNPELMEKAKITLQQEREKLNINPMKLIETK